MNQIGPLRDWAGEGGGGASAAPPPPPEGAGLTPGRSQLRVPTAGGLRLLSFLDFLSYRLFSASPICQPRRQLLDFSVAVFLHFSWFVSASAVSLLPSSPGLDHSPGLQCRRRECLTQRPDQPERDGGAGVPCR